jgi:membrane protease subunit (stomatin/prohibitin family)
VGTEFDMAAKHITIGSHTIAAHLEISDQPDANDAVNAVFQAAFEVGFNKGLEAGLLEARQAAAQYSAAKHSAAPSAQPGPRRSQLGLPCPNCGCYFYSDEAQCPRCKHQGPG